MSGLAFLYLLVLAVAVIHGGNLRAYREAAAEPGRDPNAMTRCVATGLVLAGFIGWWLVLAARVAS
jgi:hypothetical protein